MPTIKGHFWTQTLRYLGLRCKRLDFKFSLSATYKLNTPRKLNALAMIAAASERRRGTKALVGMAGY
jgi:hypothetical protein